MIKTEAIESLDGSIYVPVKDLVTLNTSGVLTTPDGRAITIVASNTGGGTYTGGGTVPPPVTDTTAPIFDESITISNVTTTTAVLNTSVDEICTIYYSIVVSGGTALTNLQIKNAGGTFNGNLSVNTSPFSASFNISGLTTGTNYDCYIVSQDTAGNYSTISKVSFTTIFLTETQDLSVNITGVTIDALPNNIYSITQETNEPGWSKFEPIITQNPFSLVTSGGTSMAVSKIKFLVKTAGYQIIKILLYDVGSTTPIAFSRIDASKVALSSNNLITGTFVSNGMMLVTNTNYELSNVLNTDKMPVAGTTGWYALSANTDATAGFTLTFSSPINVASAKIYRCGGSTSFNGGTDSYTVSFIDNAGVIKDIDVPKVDDIQFATISAYTSASLATPGVPIDIETKKHIFDLSYSYDGITFTNLSSISNLPTQDSITNLWTVDYTYPQTNIVNSNQRKLYMKIPDVDITYLKNLKINFWYLS